MSYTYGQNIQMKNLRWENSDFKEYINDESKTRFVETYKYCCTQEWQLILKLLLALQCLHVNEIEIKINNTLTRDAPARNISLWRVWGGSSSGSGSDKPWVHPCISRIAVVTSQNGRKDGNGESSEKVNWWGATLVMLQHTQTVGNIREVPTSYGIWILIGRLGIILAFYWLLSVSDLPKMESTPQVTCKSSTSAAIYVSGPGVSLSSACAHLVTWHTQHCSALASVAILWPVSMWKHIMSEKLSILVPGLLTVNQCDQSMG